MVRAVPQPELFGVVKYSSLEELPDPKVPYYIVSSDGLYLHKQTVIGPVILKEKFFPENWSPMGDYKTGFFNYSIPRVPGPIVSQALDYFRQVFDQRKAEAEVLILFNEETTEFQLFVPWQVVTGGSVKSLHDQADLPLGWTVIGTIHSHCDFGAFHSGIDTRDASSFNGLHITIGNVNRENPSFAAMVMINGIEFTFKIPEEVAAIEEDLNQLAAPAEWHNFILNNAAEVLAMDFKSLTKEEIDAFVKDNLVKTVVVHETPKTSYFPSEHKPWQGNYQRVIYSQAFGTSFPVEWYTRDHYDAPLKPEFAGPALIKVMEKWTKIAEDNGFFLNYELFSLEDLMAKEEKEKN